MSNNCTEICMFWGRSIIKLIISGLTWLKDVRILMSLITGALGLGNLGIECLDNVHINFCKLMDSRRERTVIASMFNDGGMVKTTKMIKLLQIDFNAHDIIKVRKCASLTIF